MATWIVHLRIAENLLERIPNLDAGQFAIGNTAPDSGVPDENWEHFDPPSHVTHFLSPERAWTGSADVDFYQQYLTALDPVSDKERFSFRLGYFFHLITDNLWRIDIYRPSKERFAAKFETNQNMVSSIKKDWYGLDLAYVRDHPAFLFWHTYLNAQPDGCDLDFLPLAAVKHQINYIKSFYKDYKISLLDYSAPPYTYLTQVEVDSFVEKATEQLYRIYQAIWVEKVTIPAEKTFLNTIV